MGLEEQLNCYNFIAQTAASIDLEVLARQQLGNDLITAQSNISLLSDSITLMVSTL